MIPTREVLRAFGALFVVVFLGGVAVGVIVAPAAAHADLKSDEARALDRIARAIETKCK